MGNPSEFDALVFARCAGFVARAPGFSHPAVPPPLRAGLSFLLARAIALGLPTRGDVGGSTFVLALAVEAAIGAAIGMAASMLYDGAYAGGRLLDDYVGIHATVPSAGLVAGAGFGRLWSLAFVAAFFVLGGDRIALEAFADAFRTLPVGEFVRSGGLAGFAIALPATLLRAALAIGGPAIAIAFVVQCSLAAVARVVPRFSSFTLAFPIVFGCVLLVTLGALPFVLQLAARPWFDLRMLRPR
jgi:flagellar biosynthetic protein FliR